MTSITDEIVPVLRRSIQDNEEPYVYGDVALAEYIEDAINKMQLKIGHDYTIDRKNHQIDSDIEGYEKIIFSMQAKLDILYSQPEISYRTGTISVTRKTNAKKQLQEELDELVENILMQTSLGVSTNEFDDYINRFDNILYGYFDTKVEDIIL